MTTTLDLHFPVHPEWTADMDRRWLTSGEQWPIGGHDGGSDRIRHYLDAWDDGRMRMAWTLSGEPAYSLISNHLIEMTVAAGHGADEDAIAWWRKTGEWDHRVVYGQWGLYHEVYPGTSSLM